MNARVCSTLIYTQAPAGVAGFYSKSLTWKNAAMNTSTERSRGYVSGKEIDLA